MSFLAKLFGKKTPLVTSAPAPEVPADLFTETRPPADTPPDSGEGNPHKLRGTFRPVGIREFLEQPFWQQGYQHALQFPVQERRESALQCIRADWRQALQRALQRIVSEKQSHEQQMLSLAGVSHVLDSQMQKRARELEDLEKALHHQLELSVDDEGWIAPALAAYNDGFQVGALEYARTNDLLGGLTSLH